MDKSYEKSMIRKSVLQARSSLSAQEVEYKSKIIVQKLFQFEQFERSKTIMCYMDFRNEVMTRDFIEECITSGKKISIPYIYSIDNKMEMLASRLISLRDDLEIGNYGILEPKKDRIRVVDPYDIDFCVVPGVAFDTRKNRIGYGAGFYDRFLKKVRNDCLNIGIAFDLQLLDSIPTNEDDFTLDSIVTENRIVE